MLSWGYAVEAPVTVPRSPANDRANQSTNQSTNQSASLHPAGIAVFARHRCRSCCELLLNSAS
ncbi:protein of unknown function [Pararobbsia alpina]